MGSMAAVTATTTATATTAAKGASAALPAVRSGEAAQPSPRLVRAAHEFEGMMMSELLKPMTQGDALTGDDDDDSGMDSGLDAGSGSGGALSQFASQALGQAVSASGGFGIANLIIHQLSPHQSSHSDHQHETGKVTTNLHRNTVMRSLE